jgi:O-antigen/teichoic acid export membrane protein
MGDFADALSMFMQKEWAMGDFVSMILALVVWFGGIGIPIMKILNKAGFSRAWVLVTVVPLANFICLWVFAFARWPTSVPAETV